MQLEDKWLCDECGHRLTRAEMLEGVNPFDSEDTIVGCPECKLIDCFTQLCNIPHCTKIAGCGTPTKHGYLRCCYKHYVEHGTKGHEETYGIGSTTGAE